MAGVPTSLRFRLLALFAAVSAWGLVAGGRGAPPQVRAARLSQPFTELVSFSAWLRSIGRVPSGRVMEWRIQPADRRVATALGIDPGSAVYGLVRVRLADGEPVMIERTAFPLEIGQLVGEVDLEAGSIFASLAERGIVFDRARQEIDAVGASAADARVPGVSDARAAAARPANLLFAGGPTSRVVRGPLSGRARDAHDRSFGGQVEPRS